jgi:hypothetical protein
MTIALASGGDSGWSPLLVAIVGGLAAVITSFVTTFLTGRANLKLEREKFKAEEQLERQKFESSLILQIIATGKLEAATENLDFLLDAGILPDPKGLIRAANSGGRTAVLPARGGGEEWWSAPIRPGKARWNVRTGSDPDAIHVKDICLKTTIEQLVKEPRPQDMPKPNAAYPEYQNRRAEGVERTIYQLEADIVSCKLESNGSFHLTLQGETGATMIATCPNPEPPFLAAGNRWSKEIAAVRKQVEERLHPDRSMKRTKERVRITGVGLFFQLHGRVGEAPNALELSPVLKIEWLSSS